MTYYKSNIFNFDLLIMPIWVPSAMSWCLIVVSLKDKIVHFYDPLHNDTTHRPSMTILFRYLSKEYHNHLKSSFVLSEYGDISYNEVILDRFDIEDSGVFVCK
jgi:Ulp1 family protease